MFRRRPLRRRVFGPLRPVARGPIGPRQHPGLERLQNANQLMSEGSYDEAGGIFQELASAAVRMKIPRAPQLFLQAGNAFIQAGKQSHGIELFRKGLTLMGQMGQFRRLPAASQRVIQELEALGLKEEGEAIKAEVQGILSQQGLTFSAPSSPQKPRLPVKCPSCGGRVHPLEIEWIDEFTASCDYCGSILEGSSN